MPVVGDWKPLIRDMSTLPRRIDKRLQIVSGRNALEYAKFWKEGIKSRTLGLKPNRPLTVAAKQSSTPGIDHGDMTNEIKAHKAPGGAWFAGIIKNAKSKDGHDLVDIYALFEYGTEKPIKPKGHPFLAIPVTREASRVDGARNFPRKLVFHKTASGGVLVEHKRTVTKIHYVLVRSVTIPARPAMRKSFAIFEPRAKKRIQEGIEDELYVGRRAARA